MLIGFCNISITVELQISKGMQNLPGQMIIKLDGSGAGGRVEILLGNENFVEKQQY